MLALLSKPENPAPSRIGKFVMQGTWSIAAALNSFCLKYSRGGGV
jgi:hypothetical protein